MVDVTKGIVKNIPELKNNPQLMSSLNVFLVELDRIINRINAIQNHSDLKINVEIKPKS